MKDSHLPNIGFGLERIGFAVLAAPRIWALLLLALVAACIYGMPLLKSNDQLSEVFRSKHPIFLSYERMSRMFPTSEYDVLVVVEGKRLLDRENLAKLNELHYELAVPEHVTDVLSPYSMVGTPQPGKRIPPPLIPDELPKGKAYDKLIDNILKHPLVGNRFISGNRDNALFLYVVSLDKAETLKIGLQAAVDSLERAAKEVMGDAKVSVHTGGAPVMQLELRNAVNRDRLVYNSLGFALGFLICLVFFRRLKLVLMVSLCPIVTVIVVLGAMGLLGQEMNSFINVVPALVMVIAFADAMHMVVSVRRQILKGKTRREAAAYAVRTVGPACALAALTTTAAMFSLLYVDSALITDFAITGAVGTLVAFFVVMALVPLLTLVLIGDEARFREVQQARSVGLSQLDSICAFLAGWLKPRATVISVLGLALFAAFLYTHLQLSPRYRLSDQIPSNQRSAAAMEQLESKLSGAQPFHILVSWPKDKSLTSPDVISAIGDAHKILEDHREVGNVWSVEMLRRWLAAFSNPSPEDVKRYLSYLPNSVVRRFVNEKGRSVLVTGRVADLQNESATKLMSDLEGGLAAWHKKYPGFTAQITGLPAVTATMSARMIRQLNYGLMSAMAVVIVIIGLAFRSLYVSVMSILPNVFPIAAAGALIYFWKGGIDYSSIIALTVSFGLAVDDTIHFLSRIRIERDQGYSPMQAITGAIEHVGPVLILTTLVLGSGLVVSVASDLPALRQFGTVCTTSLIAALAADLFILPAALYSFSRSTERTGAKEEAV